MTANKSTAAEETEAKYSLFVPAQFRESTLRELKGAPLSVYLAYKSYANKLSIAWPSLRTLAAVTGYGVNAVKDARKRLVQMGLLVPVEQERVDGKFGLKRFYVCTVARKQAHGTVASSTVAPCTVARKQCQEGSPSEGSPSEGYPANVVRRPKNAERRVVLSQGKNCEPSVRKSKKLLATCLAERIIAGGDTLRAALDRTEKRTGKRYDEWWLDVAKVFEWLGYPLNENDPAASYEFVAAVYDTWDRYGSRDDLTRGNFCSKVIDYLEKCQRDGEDGAYWPPSFQAHRDELRRIERGEIAFKNPVRSEVRV